MIAEATGTSTPASPLSTEMALRSARAARASRSASSISSGALSGVRVARELDRLMIERGKPKMVVSDNGSELTSNAILTWAEITAASHGTTSRRATHAECLYRELQRPAAG
jgi:hypothetical protein